MIIRRLVLSLALILFASVTIGVILGLDDAARKDLAGLLPDAGAVTASPEPTATEPTPSVTAVAKPKRTPTPTPKPTPRPTASAAKPKPKPKPKPTATPRPTATKKPTTAPKKPAPTAKKADSRYLAGPLKKGRGGTVYLTFDDGPSPHTAQILAILTRTGSTATFFHLGVNEPGFPHADSAIRKQGSRVANHTYNHPDLTTLSGSQLRWQLRNGPRGKCFRPPYGATNAKVRSAIAKAGMRQVLWSVDTLDWSKPGVATLAKSGRLKGIQDGTIILMHDGGGDRRQTVAALPTIIGDLKARGFRLRALPYC